MRAISAILVALGAAAALIGCGPQPSPVGTGGSGGAGGVGGTGGTPGDHPCTQSPSQTVILGDSYLNWPTHTFLADLASLAGETYTNYSAGGVSLASGGIDASFITGQWSRAVAANPRNIKTVIMDGGGNDVLICDPLRFPGCDQCKNGTGDAATVPQVCKDIVNLALNTASLMIAGLNTGNLPTPPWSTMVQAGVRDVVYIFYPHVPLNTLIGGTNPNGTLDYALPKAKALCDSASSVTNGQLRCHFIDLVPLFAGHPEYFAGGDIHENSTGSRVIAQAVVNTMKANCISQHSGCCQ